MRMTRKNNRERKERRVSLQTESTRATFPFEAATFHPEQGIQMAVERAMQVNSADLRSSRHVARYQVFYPEALDAHPVAGHSRWNAAFLLIHLRSLSHHNPQK
jgi:hypothetical protein